MDKYEITFLVTDTASVKKLQETLKTVGGKKIDENAWGKRELAYPIDKNTSAEYYTWSIEMDRNKLKDFKQKLNYDNILLRYLILKQE